jgi:hypothetical protein
MKSKITKEITYVDLGGEDLVHGFEKGISKLLFQTILSILEDQWSCIIVGTEGA